MSSTSPAPGCPRVIGVVGAGTMGAGIAQLAAQAGAQTILYDALPEGLERGRQRLERAFTHLIERGKLSEQEAHEARDRLRFAGDLGALEDCQLVIEAAPEQLELKLELFRDLSGAVDSSCVLATNTSSLSITRIAAETPGPERVVGLHFFNPAPVMRLVELVAAEQSSPEALAIARAAGEAMGKRVIVAADVAGFLVNRCNRPYSLVSLRLLAERVADVEQIDRIARMEGGFRMGPFELQDLVGLDVNHAVAEAFQRQSYGEPRYQPSPLQARMVAAGRLGRKTGRGWYSYGDESRGADDPEPPSGGGGDGREILLTGDLCVAGELAEEARRAGFDVRGLADAEAPWLILDCGSEQGSGPRLEAPRARLLFDTSLHAHDPRAAGFHVIAPLAPGSLVEVTDTPLSDPEAVRRLREFIEATGRCHERVQDGPGLVLGRIVAQLINEAAFVIGEGLGAPADVDAGMELGLGHPRGPVSWSHALGLTHVVAILDALHRELGEERYRAAPLLRRRLALGQPGL